jgi:ribosome recycling factor
MKSQPTNLRSSLKKYLSRAIGGLVLMLSIWQGISIGIDTAMAASAIDLKVPETMGSKKEIVVKELEQRAALEQDRVRSAMNDGNKSVQKSLDKARNAMENTAEKVDDANKNTMSKAEDAMKDTALKVENSAKNTAKKTKNFFGF